MRWRIERHASLPSTNDAARRRAEAGEPEGLAVVAEIQTAGRGRHGRSWASEPGGLYLSALLRPGLPAARAGLVPLAAGLAVAEALESLGLQATLRWPNDVDLQGRKVAGVLCEARLAPAARPEAPGVAWVVVGLGLNVAQDAGPVRALGGITLAEVLGRALEPAAMEAPLLQALDRAVARAEDDPAGLLRAWAARAPMLGQPVELATSGGSLTGVAEGLEPDGALRLATAAGVRRLTDAQVVRVVPAIGHRSEPRRLEGPREGS